MIILTITSHSCEKLYDLSMIDRMCHGNQEQVIKMVQVFIHQISKSVNEISMASTENNESSLRQEIHKIKPTLSYYGVVKIENSIHLIEQQLTKDTADRDLESGIRKLNKITNKVIDQLELDFGLNNNQKL